MLFQRPADSFLPQTDRELLRLELWMANRINQERASRGLSTLANHALLAAVARAHCAEMRDLNYFAHESPTPRFRSPADRYTLAFGLEPRYLSENIACQHFSGWGQPLCPAQDDIEKSHLGLMNSPGHRANILEPSVEIVGIGIVNRNRDLWITQMFSWR